MSLLIIDTPIPLKTDSDGVVRVGNTRVTLDTVIGSFKEGATAEEIVVGLVIRPGKTTTNGRKERMGEFTTSGYSGCYLIPYLTSPISHPISHLLPCYLLPCSPDYSVRRSAWAS
jgi:hypothetical protein